MTIQVRPDFRRGRGSDVGRPYAFDRDRYKLRNTVERAFNRLKQFRAVATRFDKREYMYYATVDIEAIKLWLRDLAYTHDPEDTAQHVVRGSRSPQTSRGRRLR